MMTALWNWTVSDDNAPVVGLVGLLVSLIGFAITLYQISKTKNAATAAKEEANRLKGMLSRYDGANEATKAISVLKISKTFLRSEMWPHLADSLESVRVSIESISFVENDLDSSQLAKLAQVNKHLKSTCTKIESGILNKNINIDIAKLSVKISDHQLILIEVVKALQKGALK